MKMLQLGIRTLNMMHVWQPAGNGYAGLQFPTHGNVRRWSQRGPGSPLVASIQSEEIQSARQRDGLRRGASDFHFAGDLI